MPSEPPTVEPTRQVVDISHDPNAHLERTPVPDTPTPEPTTTPTAAPTAQTVSDQELVNSVVSASVQPLLQGGKLGLILGGLSALSFLALQRLRKR
jgi:hypothetical protein